MQKWMYAIPTLLLISPMPVQAKEHYDVYSYDRWSEPVPSQAGYTAVRAVTGEDLGIGAFSEPSDLFMDEGGRLWIADTGNDRIVRTDAGLQTADVLDSFCMPDGSETHLSAPEGIYVSKETGLIYIADSGNSRVLICDDAQVQIILTKPDSVLFSQDLNFQPQKVLADKAGNVYVVLSNITTGAAMFSPEGEFMGYYGANAVQSTPKIAMKRFRSLLSTEEMRSSQSRTVPSGITNLDADAEGFLYTCSASVSQTQDTVKKVNPAGDNLFTSLHTVWGDQQPVYDITTRRQYQPMISDIDIAEDGSINCLDRTTGRVFQYNKEGELLFIFGSLSEQLGGFREVTALESFGTQVYVADDRKHSVTIFEETDFGALVHEATACNTAGNDDDALELWYAALQYDGNYRPAFLGISAGLLIQGDYREAMRYAKLADSSYYYDRAFSCYRREWMKIHGGEMLAAVLVLIVAGFLLHLYRTHRKERTT